MGPVGLQADGLRLNTEVLNHLLTPFAMGLPYLEWGLARHRFPHGVRVAKEYRRRLRLIVAHAERPVIVKYSLHRTQDRQGRASSRKNLRQLRVHLLSWMNIKTA